MRYRWMCIWMAIFPTFAGEVLISPETRMLMGGCLRLGSLGKPLTIKENSPPFLFDLGLVKNYLADAGAVQKLSPEQFLEKYKEFSVEKLVAECLVANPTLSKTSFNSERILAALMQDMARLCASVVEWGYRMFFLGETLGLI